MMPRKVLFLAVSVWLFLGASFGASSTIPRPLRVSDCLTDELGRIWVVGSYRTPSGFAVGYVRSDDGGQTWSAIHTISDGYSSFVRPRLLRLPSREMLAVFYTDNVYVTRSNDDGITWQSPLRIGGSSEWRCPDVLLDRDGRIWLAYFHYRFYCCPRRTDSSIEVVVSDDQGQTWSSPYEVCRSGSCPHLLEAYGKIWIFTHLIHDDPDIYVTCSEYEPSVWTAPRKITPDEKPYDFEAIGPEPVMDAAGRLWVFYYSCAKRPPAERGDYYITSDDAGMTWSPEKPLAVGFPNTPTVVTACRAGNRVWIFYNEEFNEQPVVKSILTPASGTTVPLIPSAGICLAFASLIFLRSRLQSHAL